ncbi:MAG: Nif3-like dinuclear metal center hexameric protein [Clostridia bacterium]|nr:Nif3-like dinuclear metal center hexameric protein [Clostridia bacterium]
MPVTVKDMMALLLPLAPVEDAEEWDNVGLLAGREASEVEAVLCALDLTEAVVDEAVRRGAQMIVTHHPILFRGRKHLREDDAEGRMLCKLIRADLALYAMHTNYDNACPGVNDALAAALGLSDAEVVERCVRVGATDAGTFGAFADRVERALGGPVRRFGDLDKPIKRVAVVGGSGGDYLSAAMAAGADAFVTGEISYHRALDAACDGLCVVEAGHAATERPGILALADALQKAADAVQYKVRILNSQVGLYL